MKKVIIAVAMAAATITTFDASAISHEYRARLAAKGCTQVDEANGTCATGESAAKHRNTGECTQLQEVNGECEIDRSRSRREIDSHQEQIQAGARLYEAVNGKYRGEAVDIMKDMGWKRVDIEGNNWKKGKFRARLMFTGEKVDGVDVR